MPTWHGFFMIFNDFLVFFLPGGTPGGGSELGGPQARILIDVFSIWDPSWTPSWGPSSPQVRRHGGSWSVLKGPRRPKTTPRPRQDPPRPSKIEAKIPPKTPKISYPNMEAENS